MKPAFGLVVPALESSGATAATVTLPGHSDADSARAGGVTRADHRMGGVAIVRTAEQDDEKIAALDHRSYISATVASALGA